MSVSMRIGSLFQGSEITAIGITEPSKLVRYEDAAKSFEVTKLSSLRCRSN